MHQIKNHLDEQNAISSSNEKTEKKSLPLIFKIFILFFAAIIFFLVFLRVSPYHDLQNFLTRPVSTRIFDRTGKLLQVLSLDDGLRREFVPLEKMPKTLPEIFIAAEDRRFYQHFGVDVGAIFRAMFQNAGAGRTVSGASTITMQLARIISPSPNRNVLAKIYEAYNAVRLELRFSKKQILEMYLNSVPFGFNTEGVASASRTFFGTNIDKLSTEQMCCLAVIPRRPTYYNPLENPQACAAAAHELYLSLTDKNQHNLQTDESNIYNSQIDIEQFMATAKKAKTFQYPFEMPHYIRYLQGKNIGLYEKAEVTLSAILQVQREAENLLAQNISMYSGNRLTNGAVLVADNKTGEILAWVGSANFFDEKRQGQIDGVLAEMQPGSSMKPFLYALALEHGFLPSSVLPDVPLEFGFDELYVPQNFNNRYNGPVRLRVALASSLNVPAVFLLNKLGISTYKEVLEKLQFQSLADKDAGLSLALGGAAVSLYEMVQAFSVFVRDGKFLPLAANADTYGTGTAEVTENTVFGKDTARLICDMLSDKNSRALGFGYAQTFETPFPAMFKTGTANQYQNITALGATPLYTVGVWMGNFSGETVVGKTGSSVPAAIARNLLVSLQGRAAPNFTEPAQYTRQKICSLSGMTAGKFCGGTMMEYIPAVNISGNDNVHVNNVCTWHTENGVMYPTEYMQWFSLKNRTGEIDSATGNLEIVSPRNGSFFFYDNSVPEQNQKLRIEAVGGAENTAVVIIDGNKNNSFEISRPFSFHIPLVRGTHKIELSCANEIASIEYTVK